MKPNFPTSLLKGLILFMASYLMVFIPSCTHSNPATPIVDSELDAELSSGKLVLLKFGAEWCGPCRMIDAELEKLRDMEPKLLIIKVDVDIDRELARQFKVRELPTLIVVRRQSILDRQVGYMPASELSGWVREHYTDEERNPS